MAEPILTPAERDEMVMTWPERTRWLVLIFIGHYRRDLIPERARVSRFNEWSAGRRERTLRAIAHDHPEVFDAAAAGVGRVDNMLAGGG